MKVIRRRVDLLENCKDGYATCDLVIANKASLIKVDFLKSFKNITFEGRVTMSGLTAIESLEGLRLGDGCFLMDLASIRSINDFQLGERSIVEGLKSCEFVGEGVVLGGGSELRDLESLKSGPDYVMWGIGAGLKGVTQGFYNSLPEHLKHLVLSKLGD